MHHSSQYALTYPIIVFKKILNLRSFLFIKNQNTILMKKILSLLLISVLGLCISCKHPTPEPDPIPEPEPTPVFEAGTLPGVFSIGPNKQVKFSSGNLQYQATTSTWRFAEKQYDIIGAANANASANYGGWIDLFGWATSGWNCGNTYYMPYEQGWVDNYSIGMGYGPLPVGTTSLTGEYANCDWGVYNAISNGGNQAGMWRTMSQEEWEYLINGRANAASKRGIACIEGQNGLVVLPDNWVLPEGCTFNAGMSAGDGMQYYSAKNYYSAEQWVKMEENGALFLPAAGGRNNLENGDITYIGEVGRYWTVTPCNTQYFTECAYAFYFDSSMNSTDEIDSPRDYGRSVRLVKDVR